MLYNNSGYAKVNNHFVIKNLPTKESREDPHKTTCNEAPIKNE